jgi:hypothetical protein
MVSSGRPRDLSRQRRMGHDPTNTLYTNRGTSCPLEIANRHYPPFNFHQPSPTPCSWPPAQFLAEFTSIRYPAHGSTPPRHGARTASRKSPIDTSCLVPHGSDQDTPNCAADESRIDTELSIAI